MKKDNEKISEIFREYHFRLNHAKGDILSALYPEDYSEKQMILSTNRIMRDYIFNKDYSSDSERIAAMLQNARDEDVLPGIYLVLSHSMREFDHTRYLSSLMFMYNNSEAFGMDPNTILGILSCMGICLTDDPSKLLSGMVASSPSLALDTIEKIAEYSLENNDLLHRNSKELDKFFDEFNSHNFKKFDKKEKDLLIEKIKYISEKMKNLSEKFGNENMKEKIEAFQDKLHENKATELLKKWKKFMEERQKPSS